MKFREQDVVIAKGKVGVVGEVLHQPHEAYVVEYSEEEGSGRFGPEELELYQQSLLRRGVLWLTAISCVVLLILQLARWSLLDLLSLPVEMMLEAVAVLVFLLSAVLSVILVLRRRIYWPFLLHLLIGMVVLMFPFSEVAMSWNYKSHLEDRMAVVQLVEAGQFGQQEGIVKLPEKYRYVSSDGQVWVQRQGGVTQILFYTFHGLLDSSSGFLYRSDGRYPLEMGSEVEKKGDHWYYLRRGDDD